MKKKMKEVEGQRSASPVKAEKWSSRDKNVSPARRAELKVSKEGQRSMSLSELLMEAMLFGALVCLIIFLAKKNSSMGQEVFQKLPTNKCSFIVNAELVQQALIVIRHSTTRGMDCACDILENGSEALSSSISRLTQVRKPRWMKKEDPDVDLLELQTQCKMMSDKFMANSLLDMDDKVDSIVKPAESLKIGMQWAMDELIQSVDDDSDDELPLGKARLSNLEPIDQL